MGGGRGGHTGRQWRALAGFASWVRGEGEGEGRDYVYGWLSHPPFGNVWRDSSEQFGLRGYLIFIARRRSWNHGLPSLLVSLRTRGWRCYSAA